MLRDRVAVSLLLLPVVLWVIADGQWLFLAAVALVLGLAAAEWGLMFRHVGLRPSVPILVAGVVVITGARFFLGFEAMPVILAALCLAAMTWHLVDYERGADRSGSAFGITLSGTIYLGWIGAYLVSLRRLPDGEWWFLVALSSVWLADSAAYFIGREYGRHKLCPRLSPKKTWEGYLASVIAGALSGAGLAVVWHIGAGPSSPVNAWTGLIVGTAIGTLAPLGDVGISMVKREVGLKDSGNLLPGHGGALDRIDSWLWAGVLGYYLAVLLGG